MNSGTSFDHLCTELWGFPGGTSSKRNRLPSAGGMRDSALTLGWKDPLEEGMATHPIILAWRIPMDRGTWQATVHGVAESQTQLSD